MSSKDYADEEREGIARFQARIIREREVTDRDAAAVEKAIKLLAYELWMDGYLEHEPGPGHATSMREPLTILRREWTTAPCTSSARCPHPGGCNGLARVPIQYAAVMEILQETRDALPARPRSSYEGHTLKSRYEDGYRTALVLMEQAARRWLEDSGAGLHTEMEDERA